MTDSITAKVVSDNARLDFLPELFGSAYLLGEDLLYIYARSLCKNYRNQAGGYWEYIALSNTSGYARPCFGTAALADGGKVSVSVPLNQYQGRMSPDAFGVTMTLFALGATWERSKTSPLWRREPVDLLVTKMDLLKDYASEHPERREIFAAID